jgi:putative membrane protein
VPDDVSDPGAPPRAPTSRAAPTAPDPTTRAREHLANERTLLAWVRTAVTLMALGFGVARFGIFLRQLGGSAGGDHHPSAAIGIALVVAGLVSGGAAAIRFFRVRDQIDRGAFVPEWWAEALLMAMILAIGVALVVYLAVTG